MAPLPLAAVILGAGKGTRMKSPMPKVLHPVGHRAMIGHVLDALAEPREVLGPTVEHAVDDVRHVALPGAELATLAC